MTAQAELLRLRRTDGSAPLVGHREDNVDELVSASAAASFALGMYLAGALGAAASALDRFIARTRTGQETWQLAPVYATAASVAALRGQPDAAALHRHRADACLRRRPVAAMQAYSVLAGAAIAQVAGDYPAMLDQLCRMPERAPVADGVFHELWWRPMYVEALIGCEQFPAADDALNQLDSLCDRAPQLRLAVSWLGGRLAHAVGDVHRARNIFALATCPPHDVGDALPLHRARLEHAYGELLLDEKDGTAAHHWLDRAQRRYTDLGAAPFAARCAALLDVGRSDDRRVGWHDEGLRLSAHERRVARLVAAGLTNKEVAHRLFVSPKTVEYHLGNIFPKLGITSRRQLRVALQAARVPVP